MARDFNLQGMMDDPRYASKTQIDPARGFRLESKMFVLGFTREMIQLLTRSKIAARVEGKSSLARMGVGVLVTAPTVHAGFGVSLDSFFRLQTHFFAMRPASGDGLGAIPVDPGPPRPARPSDSTSRADRDILPTPAEDIGDLDEEAFDRRIGPECVDFIKEALRRGPSPGIDIRPPRG